MSASVSGGWAAATSAAAVGFTAALAAGAVLVVAWKLAFPDFAAGASPVTVLTYVALAALLCLGVPIGRAGEGSSLLPLGGLALVAWALVWAARRYVSGRGAAGPRARALEGAKLAVPFALLCFVLALVFRVRPADVGADPGAALLLGALWGGLFGALGGLTTEGGMTELLRRRGGALREGLAAGLTMVAAVLVLAMATVLVYLVAALAPGRGVVLGAGETLAIVVVVAMFAPNLAAGAAGFALGAPNLFVARSFDIGFAREVSLLGFGDPHPAPYLYLALLIPLGACLFGGYRARRRTGHPEKTFEVLGASAVTFAVVLAVVVYAGALDYEAGALGEGALVVLRPAPGPVLLLGLAWAGVLGYAGWKLAETREHAPARKAGE